MTDPSTDQPWPDDSERAAEEGRQEPRDDGQTIDVGEVEVGEPDVRADESAQ